MDTRDTDSVHHREVCMFVQVTWGRTATCHDQYLTCRDWRCSHTHAHQLPLIELNLCIHFVGPKTSTHTCTPAPSNRTQPVQLSTNVMVMMSSSQVRRGFTHSVSYHNANLMGHHSYDGVFIHIMCDTHIYLYGDVPATTMLTSYE